MIKTRDIEKIKDVSLITKEINTNIMEIETNLIKKIEEMKDYYQGVEGETILNGLMNAVKKLDKISDNVNYYQDYLDKLSNNDKYLLDSYYKKMCEINNLDIKSIGGSNE